jgi:hypothetical protein
MIYITGDVHGHIDIGKLSSKKFPEGRKLTKNDYVIVTGDFGLIWDVNESRETELHWTKWLTDKPWTTLFLDGNHENFDRLFALPKVHMFEGAVGRLNDSIYHLKRGEIYQIEGHKFFVFGGGQSIDKHLRVEGISWWRQEIPTHGEMQYGIENLLAHGNRVDYILTHTGPTNALREIPYLMTEKLSDPTIKYLDYVLETVSFKMWYFSHMHEDMNIGDNIVTQYKSVVPLGSHI